MDKRIFFILLMSAFAAMLGLGVISPFLPEYAAQHHANGFWMGMIFAGFGISRGIIMPIVGKVSDRTGRKIFVVGGLFIYTVVSLFYPMADSVYEITLIRVIHGFSAGMIIPIVMAYVGDYVHEGKESVTTGTMNMMFGLGLASGPLLGGVLDQFYGSDAVFYAMALLGAVTFFIVLIFLPESKNTNIPTVSDYPKFSTLLRYNYIRGILIITVIITLMMVIFISFLPSLAEEVHVDTSHIGLIISIGIFFSGILQVPFGWFADKLDRVGKMIQIGTGTSVSMLSLLAMPFCPNFMALLFAGLAQGLGMAIAMPALTSISVTIGRKTGMGTWMGIFNTARSVGFVLTPLVFGIVMDFMGIHYVFYLAFLVAFFGIFGFSHYIRRRLRGIKEG